MKIEVSSVIIVCDKNQLMLFSLLQQVTNFCFFPLSSRKGKFLHHYENYGATAKDIADWMKKWVLSWPQNSGKQPALSLCNLNAFAISHISFSLCGLHHISSSHSDSPCQCHQSPSAVFFLLSSPNPPPLPVPYDASTSLFHLRWKSGLSERLQAEGTELTCPSFLRRQPCPVFYVSRIRFEMKPTPLHCWTHLHVNMSHMFHKLLQDAW